MTSRICTFLIVLALGGCTTKNPADQLNALFVEEWAFRSGDQFGDPSEEMKGIELITPASQKEKAAYWQSILERLESIDYNSLSESDQINYRIFKFQLEDLVARIEYEDYLMPLNAEGSFCNDFLYSLRAMRLDDKNDYQAYLKKLDGFDEVVDANIDLMKIGIKKGITQPQVILRNYKALIEPLQMEGVESPYYKAFVNLPTNIPLDTQQILRNEALTLIENEIIPAVQQFDQFMETEYIPNARKQLGASSLPNGKAYYEQRVQFFTTLPLTSDEIFEIGKKEVARIRADMERIIEELKFEGSFQEFITYLRTDPQFYAKSPKELLMFASYLSKKMDGKLPDLFNTLPSLPYGVQPVPAEIAPNYTGGRYSGGSWKNHKAGNYWVNTYKLESRPLYVLPALTLHEAVPGHHLQISLAAELEDLPDFRRNTYLSCYGEGWGLYSEYLGIETDMYETPYEDFGRMTYEMWRACRLVIDVGIHAKGWTRAQAVDYLASNTALSLHEVNTEIDRYIGWPAQALSYKMGELKIRELRTKAEAALGNQFDIRAFHDAILKNGAVPLFVLEELIDAFIEAELSKLG